MRHEDIKVSVIIPTYKRGQKYIERAIKSIKNQTYKNIEIVVVDDNPIESKYRRDTLKYMEQFKDDYSVIYHMNKKNIGGALSRNNGIEKSSGEYITFLDDDDEYLPEKIEKQLVFMIKNNSDLSFTDLTLVNNNNIVVDFREYSNLKKFDNDNLLKYHLMRHLTGTPTFMFRANKLKEISGFQDVPVGQEFFLMLKSIENNLKIDYLKGSNVIAYRHNDGSISQGANKIKGEKKLYEFKKQYFSMFTFREKMFIKFRHHAVLTIAYKRNKKYVLSVISAMMMFISSPIDCIKETSQFIKKVYNRRRMGN